MLQLLSDAATQATEIRGGPLTWTPGEWILFLGFVFVTGLPAIAAFRKSMRNDTKITNLASATQDVATQPNNLNPVSNVTKPETLATIKDIAKGGTGTGTGTGN